jgi:sugar/nucleoside kinase (ribokinase family)
MGQLTIDDHDTVDALFCGTVFLDVVLAGLPHLPEPGTEVWARQRVVSPGGIANHAVAASRLGMHSAMVAAVGADPFGDVVWLALEQEPNLDLRWARRVEHLQTALTISLAHGAERSFASHGTLDPVPVSDLVDTLPSAKACFISLDSEPPHWLSLQRAAGATIYGDVGWDPTHGWSPSILEGLTEVDVFLPSDVEAMAYTRTATAREALRALGELVPLAVVTCGSGGAMALDAGTGEEVAIPARAVRVTDPTGAGDVFTAAFMRATLAGVSLRDRLSFANLCAGLSVQTLGGAVSAPTLDHLTDLVRPPAGAGHGQDYGLIGRVLAPSQGIAQPMHHT